MGSVTNAHERVGIDVEIAAADLPFDEPYMPAPPPLSREVVDFQEKLMADVNRITGFPRELLAAPAKLSAADSGPLPARRLPEFMERALAKKAAERAANDADDQAFLNAIDEAQKDPVPDTLMPLAEAAASLGKTVPQLLRGLKGMPPRKRRSWEYTVIDDQAYVARAAVAEALAIGDSGQI